MIFAPLSRDALNYGLSRLPDLFSPLFDAPLRQYGQRQFDTSKDRLLGNNANSNEISNHPCKLGIFVPPYSVILACAVKICARNLAKKDFSENFFLKTFFAPDIT